MDPNDRDTSPSASVPSDEYASSEPSSEDTSSCHDMPDFVSLMLLTSDGSKVLMLESNESWILPRFTHYHCEYDIDECCVTLQNDLGIQQEDETVFIAVAELLGSSASYGFDGTGECGYPQLLMMESHVDPVPIPRHYDWKDSSFLSKCLAQIDEENDYHAVIKRTLHYMSPDREAALAKITDPRYRFGWFGAVSTWLTSVLSSFGASPHGRLRQLQICERSTLLKQNSSQGYFYVKSPALGSHEMSIIDALTKLMPHRVMNVLASSQKLRCFVTRAVEGDAPAKVCLLKAVQNLAEIQLESIPHLDHLRKADCPDRSPKCIAETLQKWSTDESYSLIFGRQIDQFRDIVPKLQELCALLSASNVPLTLVHGDYGDDNIAYRDASLNALIVHNFEFTCISHPFCDMHVQDSDYFFDDDATDEETRRSSNRARSDYLASFAKYCSDEALLREEYRAALVLGKILHMDAIAECMQQCDFQLASSNHAAFVSLFDWTVIRMRSLGMLGHEKVG